MKRTIGIILLTMVLLGSIVHGYEKPDAKTLWTDPTPANRLEPGGSKKNTGYVAGERPGFKTWNWLIYNLGLWTNYLEDVTDTLKTSSTTTDGHIGQTGNIGIGTSTPTAKTHIVSTGTGAAFQIDTTQQDKAIYVSSSGVVEIASMTVTEQTVENQNVTNQIVDTLNASILITSPKSAIIDIQESTTSLRADIPPIGTIIMYGGASAPTGWLLCQGQAVSSTTYAALFAVVAYTFGNPGGGDFNLPDLQDRFPVGKSGTKALGSTGGNESVTIAEAQLPSHSHSVSIESGFADSITVINTVGGSETPARAYMDRTTGNYQIIEDQPVEMKFNHKHTTTGDTGTKGSGTAVDIKPQYQAVNYIVKY